MTTFELAHEQSNALMRTLYELRYTHPPDRFPELWNHIPRAQSLLERINSELVAAEDSLTSNQG